MFAVKSAYKKARQVLKGEDWAESSNGCAGKNVWAALWKLRLPNKIKVFGWKVYHDILPTWLNLIKRQIIIDNGCPICIIFPESTIHALWQLWSGRYTSSLGISTGPDIIGGDGNIPDSGIVHLEPVKWRIAWWQVL